MHTAPVIMIAGVHGFVGARAMAHFPNAIPVGSGLLRSPGDGLADFIKQHHPDIILNAAAISDIGACAKDPEGSYRANVLLPAEMAKAAQSIGAKFVSFSSDQVYTGFQEEGPYQENIPLPTPANLYARHKLEAEQRVLDIHPDAVLLRATWMYDMPLYHHANRGNFLMNTLKAVREGTPISVSSRQYRGITYVRQAVNLMDSVFQLPGGAYNYGSENPLNMTDTAQALLTALGTEGIIRDTEEEKHNLWMDCGRIRQHGIIFDTTAEGFYRCIKDYDLN